jgi:hypothetical protein
MDKTEEELYEHLMYVWQQTSIESKLTPRSAWSMNKRYYAVARHSGETEWDDGWNTLRFRGLPILVTDRAIPAIVILG